MLADRFYMQIQARRIAQGRTEGTGRGGRRMGYRRDPKRKDSDDKDTVYISLFTLLRQFLFLLQSMRLISTC